MRIRSLLLLSLLLTAACNSAVQSVPSTQVPASAQMPVATGTPTSFTTDTPAQTPTSTPVPVTATPTLQPASATMIYSLVSTGALLEGTQMLSPVGSPLQSWHEVPIMPQATAGQEFSNIMYIYRAHATLDQARQFYTNNSQSLGLTNSSGPDSYGVGLFAGHGFTFPGYKLEICIFSFDDSTDSVNVGIASVP